MVHLTSMHKITMLQMIGYGQNKRTQMEVGLLCQISQFVAYIRRDNLYLHDRKVVS